MNQHSAAPVRAAGYRLDHLAINFHTGGPVAMPGPIRRCADWLHNSLGEHIWERPAESAQQSQAQAVNSNVVVFPMFARREQWPRVPFAALPLNREVPVAVDNVRLAEQSPFPFRGILQQLPPRNRAVMWTLEAAVIHGSAYWFIKITDQTIRDSNPSHHAQIILRLREREVHLPRTSSTHDVRSRPQNK